MKFSGDIVIAASRDAVFTKVGDPQFFASCVEGLRDLTEIDGSHYTAVMETKIAYLKFKFDVAVEVLRMNPPSEIEAALTGKLGSLGQPVLRAKMKEMEREFTKRVRAAFAAAEPGNAS